MEHSTEMSAGQVAVDVVRVRILPDGRMTRKDAALYLGLEPKTLAIWSSEGKGPAPIRVGGRAFYFKTDLDAFIQGKAA